MNEFKSALRERYPNIHPLIFHRCVEKARSDVELFDMLDSIPTEYPIIWDENIRAWVHTDLLQKQIVEEEEKHD